VQPVSAIAGVEGMVAGGPRAGTGIIGNSVLFLVVSGALLELEALGFPHCQARLARRRGDMTLLLPPIIFAAVALSLCPVALLLH
jgi:hypothetical protein